MGAKKSENQTMVPHKKLKRYHHHHHPRSININNGINAQTPTNFSLSDDVLDIIFSFLPIKHAVRMGILSTRFKNSWLFNRNLYFGRDFARGRTRTEIIKIVSRVFNFHSGSTIQCFRLYIDPSSVEFMVECWVKKSITKKVEELDLDFSQAINPFKLSFDILLDAKSITILKLTFCELDLPFTFQGLCSLRVLVLRKVEVTANSIETVFGNCMNLEVLDLAQCSKIRVLKIFTERLRNFKVLKVGDCSDIIGIEIDAPTLLSFHYCGNISNINFKSSSLKLKDAMLTFAPTRGFMQHFLTRNLGLSVAHVTVLTINSTFLEGLCPNLMDEDLREMQFCFSNLKEIQLLMESTSYCNPYDITYFLKNCPRIEKIFIDLSEFNFECGFYWELHVKQKFEQCRPCLNQLKSIKVKGFKFQNHELELVKFLLGRATSLEILALVTSKNCHIGFCDKEAEAYKRFLYSWRASIKAKIVLCDHTDDESLIYPKHLKSWY